MNTLSGVNEPYSTLTLDGLNATTTLIDDAVGDYLPLTGGTLQSSTGTTRLGISSSTQGTVEFTDTAGASKALMFYTPGNNDVSFTVGTNTRVLRVGGTQITSARNISMATTNKVVNLAPGTTANDAVNYGQTMLRSGVNAATANIPMGGFKLTGLGLGVAGDDAATVSQLTASPHFYLPLAGGTMTGNLVINRGVNPCIFTLASAGNTTIDFKDDNLVLKGSMQYNQPANSLHFDLAGVTRQSISTTAATFSIPVAMSSQKITGLLAGAGGSTDAANVAQMEAADTAVTAAFQAADALKLNRSGVGAMTGALDMGGFLIQQVNAGGAGSTNAANVAQMEAADTVVTNAFQAADALKLNRSGVGAMTGALDMGGFLIQQVNAGGAGSTNAANVAQMEAADTVVTNAYIAANTAQTTTITNAYIAANTAQTTTITNAYVAADSVVAANASAALTTEVNARVASVGAEATTRAAQDTAIQSAYIAADAVVTNNSVQKTGSIMSGTLTINNIQTCLQATHTAASLLMTMQGGSSTVPNAALIRMTAGLGAGLEFYDYSGALTGYMRFDFQHTPDQIVFNVGGVSSLIVQSGAVVCSQPLAMSTKQITGLQAGSAASHAINYGQTMLLSGVNSMAADLNMGTHKITGVADATNPQDVVVKNQVLLLDGTQAMDGTLDMNGQTVNRVYSLNSNGTDPMYVTNDGVAIAEFNSSGMTMSSGKNINMNFQKLLYLADSVDNYDAVTRIQIANSAIPLVAWRNGETVSRHFQSPALGQSLVTLSVAVGTTAVIMSTAASYYPIAVGNRLLIVFGCSCDAAGSGSDKFDIILKLGPTPTVKTFPYVLGPSTSYRDRSLLLNTLYIVENIGVTQVEISLFNNSNDTITLDDTNWHFSCEEIKA